MWYTVLLILRFLDFVIEAAIEFLRLITKLQNQKSRHCMLILTPGYTVCIINLTLKWITEMLHLYVALCLKQISLLLTNKNKDQV